MPAQAASRHLFLAATAAFTLIACSSGGSGSSTAESLNSCPHEGPEGHFSLPSDVSTLQDACEAYDQIDGINRAAIALSGDPNQGRMCEDLHQYGLFDPNPGEGFDLGDPRRPLVVEGEYQGLPYVLNTALFSDYTAKHRVVFLPEDENGDTIPARYCDSDVSLDGEPGTGDLTRANNNIAFPVGTVIAKTFTYPNISSGTPTERIIETRLLIKHTNTNDGSERWEGIAYVWEQDEETNEWIARLDPLGFGDLEEAREWQYPDPNDPNLTISGNVDEGYDDRYRIPSRQNCLECHRNADQDAGAAPIGLKARFLNRPYASEFGEFTDDPADLIDRNQIDYWNEHGWLSDLPQGFMVYGEQLANVERVTPYNVPADDSNPEADLGARARGYLEINCAHCHNEVRGSVADFHIEFQRAFCSQNFFDQGNIVAGDAEGSELYKRINTPGDEQVNEGAGNPMPRLARHLIHAEGVAVIGAWIDNMATDICD